MLPYTTRLESGPWFTVGQPLDGRTIHDQLHAMRPDAPESVRPYCIYVHVPFCASICSFCALYTQAVPRDADPVLDEYLDLVRVSIDRHPWTQADRPPTTVHFGGGTPLLLGDHRFATLVRALKTAFGTSPTCEWAVETTTSSINAATLDMLAELGFQRIHLGIQTLDDETRKRIGRQEPGARAIERIQTLHAHGFFTSIDLIIGFDEVDGAVVDRDLRRLYDAGVRMFSVCELRERGATRLGIRDDDTKARHNHALWARIWDFMADVGLKPIHLGQFARSQADNLYFTFPARGEDCVAIGPYAHGCAGDLYYGNRLLPDYYDAIRAGRSPIGPGVVYGAEARVIRHLERELLAHHVACSTLALVEDAYPDAFPPLLDRWLRQRLLVDCRGRDYVTLSRDGSWFVGNMIADARAMLSRTACDRQERTA